MPSYVVLLHLGFLVEHLNIECNSGAHLGSTRYMVVRHAPRVLRDKHPEQNLASDYVLRVLSRALNTIHLY